MTPNAQRIDRAHRAHRARRRPPLRPVLALLTIVAACVAGASTASAGGWAVTSLDKVPAPVPGQSVDVGFTVLQHGVTPVDMPADVGIEVTAADGTTSYFPAVHDGRVGHYVAAVVFPAAGEYTWRARQGMFAAHELGTITVGTDSEAFESTAGSTPWLPPVLLACTVLLTLVAVTDAIAHRRRPTAVA
jgi:hypothetical protein